MLETRNLTARFGGHVAVDAVSCAFKPGTLTAIVGPNGAGKTTYFNLISGQLRATFGHGVARRRRPHARTRVGANAAWPGACVPVDAAVSEPQRRRKRSPRGAVAAQGRSQSVVGVERPPQYAGARARAGGARAPRAARRRRGEQPAARRPAQARSGDADGARTQGLHVRRTDRRNEPGRRAGDPRADPGSEAQRRQDHPARRAQDGRGARTRGPHRRVAQRQTRRRRRTCARSSLRLSCSRPTLAQRRWRKRLDACRCCNCRACTHTSARTTSCTASTSRFLPAGDGAARSQRRRQDDDASHHHGPVACVDRPHRVRQDHSRQRAASAWRHRTSRNSASPTFRRTWASSPT